MTRAIRFKILLQESITTRQIDRLDEALERIHKIYPNEFEFNFNQNGYDVTSSDTGEKVIYRCPCCDSSEDIVIGVSSGEGNEKLKKKGDRWQ
jgi:hypothetical protein